MGALQKPWKGPLQEDILKRLAPSVLKYTQWYCENGLYLPMEYEQDPAQWTHILRCIERTFEMIMAGKKPTDSREDETRSEGLMYFFKYFSELWK